MLNKVFADNQERRCYVLLLVLFGLLTISKLINVYAFDTVELIIVAFFLFVRPAQMLIPMYLFYIFWYEAMTFHVVNISAGLLIDVIVALRLCISSNYKLHNSKSDLLLFLLLVIYAPMCFLKNGSLSGFALAAEMMIILAIKEKAAKDKEDGNFWRQLFFVITCSVLLNTIYGTINSTGVMRYVGGKTILQLSGTVYPARAGVYCVCALVYPFYYGKNRIMNIIITIFLVIMTLMTVSMTAIGALIIFFVMFLLFKAANDKKTLFKRIALICALVVGFFLVTHYFKDNQYISMIQLRIDRVINNFSSGEYGVATSGRTELQLIYYDYFRKLPLINKLLGTCNINAMTTIGATNYSHLTYLDVMICYGLVGVCAFLFTYIRSIVSRKRLDCFPSVLVLKTLIGILGAGGSLLTNTSWFLLFLI